MSSVEKKTVEVVVFKDPQKQGKPTSTNTLFKKKKGEKGDNGPKRKIFVQKQAKYDIRKLAIHGMDKKNKDVANVDLLIELGAKPPKNRCYHIQEYQKLKKQQEEQSKRTNLEIVPGVKKKKQNSKSVKRKRQKDDLFQNFDGQAGFYKKGVQFVKKMKK